MGKTKTAFVSDLDENKSSEQAYKEKKERQAKEAAAKAQAEKPEGETFITKENKNAKKAKTNKEEEKIKVPGLKGGQKVKVVEAENTLEQEDERIKDQETKEKKVTKEKIRSQKYKVAKTKLTEGKRYNLAEAIKLAQETSYSSFDGTIELHLVVKKVGTSATVTLPHSSGKTKKVEVANDETLKKLKDGKIDFDVLLATPEMMPKLVAYARVLGPKGLMPNPKNGTLISDISKAKSFSTDALTIKTEKAAPLIHTAIGKVSLETQKLIENAESIFKTLDGSKKIIRAFTKASMGPSVRIEVR